MDNLTETVREKPIELTIAINAYNEENSISRCLTAVVTAVQNSNITTEVLLLNDGSTDSTVEIAEKILKQVNGRVINQANTGRAIACQRMVEQAAGQYVLIINTHLELGTYSILNWKRTRGKHPDARLACNGDTTFDVVTNYDVFWQTLTEFGWQKYLLNKRPVSYTIENFDQYPKGTTMFVAPKQLWLEAYQETKVGETDKIVSDDTKLLRYIATKTPIWLDPSFSGIYFCPRTTLTAFTRNATYRGTTFVDSYWDSPSQMGTATKLLPLVLPVLAAITVKYPKTSIAVGSLLPSAAVTVMALKCKRSVKETIKCAQVAPIFAAAFGAGLTRGYLTKVRKLKHK